MSFFVDPRETVSGETDQASEHQVRLQSGETETVGQSGDETREFETVQEVEQDSGTSGESKLNVHESVIATSAHSIEQHGNIPEPEKSYESNITPEVSEGAISAKTKAEFYDIIESGKKGYKAVKRLGSFPEFEIPLDTGGGPAHRTRAAVNRYYTRRKGAQNIPELQPSLIDSRQVDVYDLAASKETVVAAQYTLVREGRFQWQVTDFYPETGYDSDPETPLKGHYSESLDSPALQEVESRPRKLTFHTPEKPGAESATAVKPVVEDPVEIEPHQTHKDTKQVEEDSDHESIKSQIEQEAGESAQGIVEPVHQDQSGNLTTSLVGPSTKSNKILLPPRYPGPEINPYPQPDLQTIPSDYPIGDYPQLESQSDSVVPPELQDSAFTTTSDEELDLRFPVSPESRDDSLDQSAQKSLLGDTQEVTEKHVTPTGSEKHRTPIDSESVASDKDDRSEDEEDPELADIFKSKSATELGPESRTPSAETPDSEELGLDTGETTQYKSYLKISGDIKTPTSSPEDNFESPCESPGVAPGTTTVHPTEPSNITVGQVQESRPIIWPARTEIVHDELGLPRLIDVSTGKAILPGDITHVTPVKTRTREPDPNDSPESTEESADRPHTTTLPYHPPVRPFADPIPKGKEEPQGIYRGQNPNLQSPPRRKSPVELPDKDPEPPVFVDPAMALTKEAIDKLTDTLDAFKTTIANKAAPSAEHSIRLESFVSGKSDPHSWWDRLHSYCELKGPDLLKIFPLYVDDETGAWFRTVKPKDVKELKEAFLSEFGSKSDHVWDKRKSLQEMKQGPASASEFVRRVLVQAYQVFDKDHDAKLEDHEQNEVLITLMNGFNPKIKTFMLLRKVKTLQEVFDAVKETKSLEDPPGTDTVVHAVREEFQNLVLPVMSDMKNTLKDMAPIPRPPTPPISSPKPVKVSEKFTKPPRDSSLDRVPRERSQTRSASPSPRSSRESSPRGQPQKKVTFTKNVRKDSYSNQPPGPNYNARVKCTYCGNMGHTRTKCALAQTYNPPMPGYAAPQVRGAGPRPQTYPQIQHPFMQTQPYAPQPPQTYQRLPRSPFDLSKIQCFHCGRMGHFKRDCRILAASYNRPRQPVLVSLADAPCQICKETGHSAVTCKQRVPENA